MLIAMATIVVVGVMAFVGIARATDQPSFCRSACHEMEPFHDAWSEGPHAGISCIECHVDAGNIERMKHKVVALQEVAAHVAGDPKFPQNEPANVPSERCLRCHTDIKVAISGFSHDEHKARGECVMCHSTAGHSVSVAALKEAGIYNAEATQTAETTKSAVVDNGKANLPGHVAVPCSRCHDMAATGCAKCHTPKHVDNADRGTECTTCHATGEQFVFTHPQRTDCGTCHKPKSEKHTWTQECTTCHVAGAGVSFAFTHPASEDCQSCHTAPAKHRDGACTQCHKNRGANWAFTHPSSGTCATCHARPAGHKAGACQACHRNTGVNWAYSHPGSGASCIGCHARPAGHKAGACQSCHRNAGANWAFAHPGSGSKCTSCHNRPAKHRSGSCVSCHTAVGKSWAFKHPSSKSNCGSCHPRPAGHRSGSCTTCHSVGKSWSFKHPGNGASCANCHPRPGGHNGGACQNCHSVGSKWVFDHPNSTSCSSCHKAPGGHYGTSCVSCHSPSRSWKSATFSHPRVPGGEHTYKSFACTKCHPSSGTGPGHFCSCHGNTTGPKDD